MWFYIFCIFLLHVGADVRKLCAKIQKWFQTNKKLWNYQATKPFFYMLYDFYYLPTDIMCF